MSTYHRCYFEVVILNDTGANVKTIVLTSRYPSVDSPYSHMFVHTRSMQYLASGCSVLVLVPAKHESSYVLDGVSVVLAPVSKLASFIDTADRIMIHLLYHRIDADTDAGYLYEAVLKSKIPTLFFIHGVETQTIWSSRRYDISWLSPKTIARYIYRDFYLIKRMTNTLKSFLDVSFPCRFVTPSQWMLDESYRHTGLDLSDKSLIIPNGIDTSHFEFKDLWNNRFNFLSIRPLFLKGKYAIDLLLESSSNLPDNFQGCLYGNGPDEYIIQQKINQLTNKKIKLIPKFLNQNEIPRVHRLYGIYAAVTRMDAQGVSMCEAMASGLPVVSYDTCAIPEFITHLDNGLLATSYDVTQFSSYIEMLADDRRLFDKIALNARHSMEKIDIRKTTLRELSEDI